MSEDTQFVTVSRATTLADHWGLVLTYGVLTFGIGLVLAVWPGETLTVLAVLLAIELILMGSVRMLLGYGLVVIIEAFRLRSTHAVLAPS